MELFRSLSRRHWDEYSVETDFLVQASDEAPEDEETNLSSELLRSLSRRCWDDYSVETDFRVQASDAAREDDETAPSSEARQDDEMAPSSEAREDDEIDLSSEAREDDEIDLSSEGREDDEMDPSSDARGDLACPAKQLPQNKKKTRPPKKAKKQSLADRCCQSTFMVQMQISAGDLSVRDFLNELGGSFYDVCTDYDGNHAVVALIQHSPTEDLYLLQTECERLELHKHDVGSRVLLELISYSPSGDIWVRGLAELHLFDWLKKDASEHHPEVFNHFLPQPLQNAVEQIHLPSSELLESKNEKKKKILKRLSLNLEDGSEAEILLEFQGKMLSKNIVYHLRKGLAIQCHMMMIHNPQKLMVHCAHPGGECSHVHDFSCEHRLHLFDSKKLDNGVMQLMFPHQ